MPGRELSRIKICIRETWKEVFLRGIFREQENRRVEPRSCVRDSRRQVWKVEKGTQWKASLDRLWEHITHKTAPLFYEGLSVDAELRVKEQQQEKTKMK